MDWEGSGGGFMNDSIVDEPQQLTNNVTIGGDDKNKAITAVSVSQVTKLTRPNEGLVLHGKKVYHVKLVAFVHEILDMSSQKIHVLVDDYTSGGPLEVSHIIGDTGAPGDPNLEEIETEGRPLSKLKSGDYIRCVGVVKYNQDKSNLVAYNMRIVDHDPNEVTMHILEVIRDSMFYERLQTSGAAPLTAKSEKALPQQVDHSAQNYGNLSTRDKHLLKFLRDKDKGQGIPLSEICENFKAFTPEDIRASLTLMSHEGQCWQGDGEDIWCVASS